MEKRTVFFTMINHPQSGWTRVGNAYGSRHAATEWLPFVRGAWRGAYGQKFRNVRFILKMAKFCEKLRNLLDTKYNMTA